MKKEVDFKKAKQNFINEAINKNADNINHINQNNALSYQAALSLVKQNGKNLKMLDEKFKQDKEIVKNACLSYVHSLAYASTTLLSDYDFMKQMITFEPYAYRHCTPKLKENASLAVLAIDKNLYLLTEIPAEVFHSDQFISLIKNKRSLLNKILYEDPWALYYMTNINAAIPALLTQSKQTKTAQNDMSKSTQRKNTDNKKANFSSVTNSSNNNSVKKKKDYSTNVNYENIEKGL